MPALTCRIPRWCLLLKPTAYTQMFMPQRRNTYNQYRHTYTMRASKILFCAISTWKHLMICKLKENPVSGILMLSSLQCRITQDTLRRCMILSSCQYHRRCHNPTQAMLCNCHCQCLHAQIQLLPIQTHIHHEGEQRFFVWYPHLMICNLKETLVGGILMLSSLQCRWLYLLVVAVCCLASCNFKILVTVMLCSQDVQSSLYFCGVLCTLYLWRACEVALILLSVSVLYRELSKAR